LKSFEQQIADQVSTLTAWLVVLTLALTATLSLAVYGVVNLASDEARTCQVQAQGLPAGQQQVLVMADIYRLLTLKPETRAERLAAHNESPAVRLVVRDLTRHLALYEAAQAKLPHGRVC
jgi:hypothetical protein